MPSPRRVPEYAIDPQFTDRWSPRSFSHAPITVPDLLALFEAARWAPSSYNSQPWRFVYGIRGTPAFDQLLGTLIEVNQSWAKNAAALVVVVSKIKMAAPGQEKEVVSHSHSFDAGAAWMSLALQAERSGWRTHGMVGMDMDRAGAELDVPPEHRIEAAIAIGRAGDGADLPDHLRAHEAPSQRQPLDAMVFKGKFPPIVP